MLITMHTYIFRYVHHTEFMWCYVRNECCDNNKNNNNNTNHNHKYNNTD